MPKKTRYTHAVNKKKLGNRYANEPTSDSHSESTSVGRQQQQQQKKRRRRCQYNKKKRRNGPTPSPPPPALRWGPISCSESDLRRFTTFECARQFLPPILFIYFFFTATEFPRFTLHNETLSLGSFFFASLLIDFRLWSTVCSLNEKKTSSDRFIVANGSVTEFYWVFYSLCISRPFHAIR